MKVSILGPTCVIRELIEHIISRELSNVYHVTLPPGFGFSLKDLIDKDEHYKLAIFIGEVQWDEVRYAVRNGLKVLITNRNITIPMI